MSYRGITIVFAVLLATVAVTLGVFTKKWPNLYRRLPRAKVAGVLLGTVCLIWAVSLVLPMLEDGLAKFRTPLKAAVPLIAIVAYFQLDYLFARAFGGLVLLCLHHMIYTAFVVGLPQPYRGVFSLICYALGILGLFFIGAPWIFRDILKKAAETGKWRIGAGAVAGLLALFYLFSAFMR